MTSYLINFSATNGQLFCRPAVQPRRPIAATVYVDKKIAPHALLFRSRSSASHRHRRRHLRGVRAMLKEDSVAPWFGSSASSPCLVLHVIAWLGAPYLYIPTRSSCTSLPFLITLIFTLVALLFLDRVTRLRSSAKLEA